MKMEARAYFLSNRTPPIHRFCLKTAHPKSRKRPEHQNTRIRIVRFLSQTRARCTIRSGLRRVTAADTMSTMRWLLHGNLTPAVSEALKRHEHTPVDLAAVGLDAAAEPRTVLEAAKKGQLDLLTADAALAQSPFELDFWFDRSMVYLQLEGGDVEQDDAIDRLFARYKRLSPGRLYTVTGSRVKVRQLPARK